jgi:hypothetical protein
MDPMAETRIVTLANALAGPKRAAFVADAEGPGAGAISRVDSPVYPRWF